MAGNTTMYRCEVTVTGVAGGPNYLVGYFDAAGGTALQASQDWFTFCSAAATSIPSGVIVALNNVVTLVDPVSGSPTGTVGVSPASITGTSTADFLPRYVQGLVRWRTGEYIGGREIRGRTNIPLRPESINTAAGTPDPAFLTSQDTKAAALIASATSTLVVWSKKNGSWSIVTSGGTWNQWSVLRSRRD